MVIRANAPFVLFAGSRVQYTGNAVHLNVWIDSAQSLVNIEMRVFDINNVDTFPDGQYTLFKSSSDVAGYTGNGTNDLDRFLSACMQLTKSYLEAIPENSGVVFTTQ